MSVGAGQAGASAQAATTEHVSGQSQTETEQVEVQYRSNPDTPSTSKESSSIANADRLEHHDAAAENTPLSPTRHSQEIPINAAVSPKDSDVADLVVLVVPHSEGIELEERGVEVMANGHARETTRDSLEEIPDEP